MKKSDLLELLQDLPDDAEIGVITGSYEHGYHLDTDLSFNVFFHNTTGEKVYSLNTGGDELYGYSDEQSYLATQKVKEFIKAFPVDKYWSACECTYMSQSALVTFKIDDYSRRFRVIIDPKKEFQFLIDNDRTKGFNDVAGFFESTRDFVKECVKMQMEKMTRLLEELGTLR